VSDTILMKIGDGKKIVGESTIDGHKEEITLLSYSHSVAMPMTSDMSNTKRTSGKAIVSEFTVTKFLDKGSPTLNQNCCSAQDMGEVVITLVQNDQGKYIDLMKYTLSNVLISSVSVGGGGGGIPTETVTLSFSKIKWDYLAQKTAGSAEGVVPGVWDLTTNKAE
jgi:type VI secretion system secreted protein Hcp